MDAALEWLMQGDAAIRWQTIRDVLGAPKAKWQAERKKVAVEGWGARLLDKQDKRGMWGGGLYTPKWTSTTYTLLQLRELGLLPNTPAAQVGVRVLLEGMLGKPNTEIFAKHLSEMDLCVTGMMLSLAVYFGVKDSRSEQIVTHLLEHEMPDGGWNCRSTRSKVHHSSFHTTFNVLDGLREYVESRARKHRAEVLAAEQRAFELMFQHGLFRSDKTREIIHPKFVKFTYPFRWHYDVLRALDAMQRADAPRDARLSEAMEVLESKRSAEGTWKNEGKYGGKTFFDMESVGKPSRWNTLRARRVLRWWHNE